MVRIACLFLVLPVLASALNSTHCKACLELVKYRLLEDELDIEDCLQLSPQKAELLDWVLVTHLLYCHRNIDTGLVATVVSRLPGLYLNETETAFLHLPIGNCSLEQKLSVNTEDRAEYQAIIESAKEYDYKPPRIRGWAIIISGVLACFGLCNWGIRHSAKWVRRLEGRERKTL